MISTAIFGDASAVYDAFLTAWRVPNLFRRLFGEGALSTSLQTAITEADGDRGPQAGRSLFRGTVVLTAWILVAVTLGAMLVVAFLPDTAPLLGWRWLGADPEPVRDLTVRLLPFVLLVCIAALCGGALHVRGHYAAPNLAPTLMNLVWIATLVVLAVRWSSAGGGAAGLDEQWEMARVLAWGVLLGGAVQLAVHLRPLARLGYLGAEPPGGGAAPEVIGDQDAAAEARAGAWNVLRTAAPLALGAAVYQINVMVDGLMAEGLLPDGGPTALYKANRIQQFPLALVAIATTSAVFPSLKALGHLGRRDELRRLHDRSQLGIVFLALPAAVALFVLAEPICAVLFQRGNYGPEGVQRMAAALRMLALALLPAGAAGLAGRAYYALGDFTTPVRISILLLVVNVGLNALFVAGLGMDTEGLALATAVTSWGSLALLLPGLTRRLDLPASGIGAVGRIARVVLASAACGGAALGTHAALAGALVDEAAARDRSVAALVGASLGGLAAFLVAARVLRVPELGELARRVRERGRSA